MKETLTTKKKQISQTIDIHLKENNVHQNTKLKIPFLLCLITSYLTLIFALIISLIINEQQKELINLVEKQISEGQITTIYLANAPSMIDVVIPSLIVVGIISIIALLIMRKYLIVKYISTNEEENKYER